MHHPGEHAQEVVGRILVLAVTSMIIECVKEVCHSLLAGTRCMIVSWSLIALTMAHGTWNEVHDVPGHKLVERGRGRDFRVAGSAETVDLDLRRYAALDVVLNGTTMQGECVCSVSLEWSPADRKGTRTDQRFGTVIHVNEENVLIPLDAVLLEMFRMKQRRQLTGPECPEEKEACKCVPERTTIHDKHHFMPQGRHIYIYRDLLMPPRCPPIVGRSLPCSGSEDERL